jgi:molybdenum cofactor guanylyltransferase
MPDSFTAALLAGGNSSRMGQDKSTLRWQGQALWQHQIHLLETLNPTQILISGRPDGPYMGSDYTILYDQEFGQGPLAGLEALLSACTSPRLLVLAVDMPWMTRSVLDQLLSFEKGVAPEHAGWWEGTAAVYPVNILPLVRDCLSGPDRSFQTLIRQAIRQDLLKTWMVPKELENCFQSWNTADT